jgi:hypothetical protein
LKRSKELEYAENWRTGLSGAPGPYRCQPATLGKTKVRSAIIHRTIRCATELSGEPAEQQLPARNGRLCQMNSAATVQHRSQSSKSEGHRTVRCRKKTKLQRSTQLRTLTVGCHGGAPDKEQCLSSGTPDCPVRPSPTASPTAMEVVGDYRYTPTTSFISIQAFQTSHSIQEQKTPLQDTSNRLSPL